jgi:outer membrane protein OmpA-like peptidoglycan-associated protein
MKLSRYRVNVVKDYLVKKGIAEARITSKGFGGAKPIADNEAEETRALNRRVEFTITKD